MPESCIKQVEEWRARFHCRKRLYDSLTRASSSTSDDDCECYPPCHDVVYDATYSLSTLPDVDDTQSNFHIEIEKFLEQVFPPEKAQLLRKKYGTDAFHGKVKGQMSRLNVHIADSNIIKTTEQPDYEAIRLVSDVGGLLGLWIGVSVITLFEVLQVLHQNISQFKSM